MLEGQPFDGWCSHGRIIQPVSRAWAGIIAPRAGRWRRKAVNGLTPRLVAEPAVKRRAGLKK
jgi:hypothetical protein